MIDVWIDYMISVCFCCCCFFVDV